MAQDKKSFLVYCDLIHTIKKMKKEDAGELFLHLLEYTNDLNPTTENMVVELVFEPIKQQLKRDLKSYEKSIIDKSINGRLGNLKRWNKDLYLQVDSKEITIEQAEVIAVNRKTSLGDKESRNPIKPIANIAVTDTDNVTDNVNDTVIKKRVVNKFTPPQQIEVIGYFIENGYNEELAIKAFKYYETGNWKDGKGNQVKNWKQKMQSVWFKEENKIVKKELKLPKRIIS